MKIKTLTLYTSVLQDMQMFYHKVLGFPLLDQTTHSFSLQTGLSILRFEQVTDQTPHYHFAFSIPRNKVQEAKEWLLQRTELLPGTDGEPVTHFANWDAYAMYFHDPQSNIVEFIAREDLSEESDLPFSAASVIALNEIGLVVDAPLTWARAYMDEAPILFFARGPVSETFTVLGDTEGLLIVSHPGRNWFPTQYPAEKHALQAELLFNNQLFSLSMNPTT